MARVDGVFIVDKPAGFSSNQVLQRVKRLLGAKKAGHTGSLDPLATGVLPLCFGEATKLSQYVLEANKSYRVSAYLGVITDTGDADGQILEQCSDLAPVSDAVWAQIIERFSGVQTQLAPLYSALKYQGKPLYYWARKGISVPRKSREVTIYQLGLETYQHPEVTLTVVCSKGTYIRSLVEDIGTYLGCGAHVAALQRTQAGPYQLSDAMSWSDVINIDKNAGGFDLNQLLLAPTSVLPDWPELQFEGESVLRLQQGQCIQLQQTQMRSLKFKQQVKLIDQQSRLFGLGQVLSNGALAPKRLLNL